MYLDRYYYMCLNEDEKKAYKNIYSAITDFSPSVTVRGFSQKKINHILDSVLLDNPHLFYIDLSGYVYTKIMSSVTLSFNFLCTKREMQSIKNQIDDIVRATLSKCQMQGMDDYAKEIYLHDFLCKSIVYDENKAALSHTIWGAFLQKCAVCDGISKALKYLCNAVGIKCIVARGEGNSTQEESHAWNIVKINGEAYHVDVTWDLNHYDGKDCSYQYFNLPDKLMYLDHEPDFKYPVCTSTKYMYLEREKLCFFNKTDFIESISQNIIHRKNKMDYRLFLGSSKKTLEEVVRECFDAAVKKSFVMAVSVEMDLNIKQTCGRFTFMYGRKNMFPQQKFDYDSLDGIGFEEFCADILRYNDFQKVKVTSSSGDFGVDILCEYNKESYAIQCKCYSNVVGNKAVQEIFSGKAFYGCQRAVVLTNNYFTAAAEETARLTGVDLWDRVRLNELYRIATENGFQPKKY